MKKLRPDYYGSSGMLSVGFLTAVAGVFLFVATSDARAGELPSPPKWLPFEMKAINLYELGISRESSDMAGAVKTLQQARQDSTDAIVNGGGGNPAVLHNDSLIGEALMMAKLDAARTPEKPENQQTTQTQKTGANHPVKPVVVYAKSSIRIH